MTDPILPPRSIVVIHGVGDHKEDDTAKALSRALARAQGCGASWSPPSLVSRIGDVQCEVASTGEGGPPTEAFTFSAYRIEVPWPGPRWEVPLYEFYWSNLSRKGLGLLGEAAKVWRFLVGPPRIGFQSLTTPALGRLDGFLLGSARASYCLAWAMVVSRLLASLGLILALGFFKSEWKIFRYYDAMLAFDLATSILLLAFTASWWLLLLPTLRLRPSGAPGEPASSPRRRFSALNPEAFRAATTAATALAVTILFTQAVPFTILEVTQLDRQFSGMEPWRHLGTPYPGFRGFSPSHFYSINTVPGAMPYLMYGLIVVWAVFVIGVRYGLITLMVKYPAATDVASARLPNPRRDLAVARMDRIVRSTKLFWLSLTILVVAVVPALIWVDYLRMERFTMGLYFYNPALPTPTDVYVRWIQNLWLHYVTYLFILILYGILAWPTLRRAMAPALELAFDVGAYFPPVLGSPDWSGVGAVIRGRGASVDPRLLEQRLTARLRAVIRYAYDRKPGPVAVVGHSLGSIIAITALREPLKGSDGGEVPIDLVTMGSPLRMLRERFPHLYGEARWSNWKFPGMRRWLNLYRAGDPIGRDLGIPGVEEVNIKNGGHSFYFEDDDVAAFLVGWLYPSLPATLNAPDPSGEGRPPSGPPINDSASWAGRDPRSPEA